ncbi:MAG: peptidoglycan editing factor PgeF [Candidatus Latescibacterota bacterium]|nr:MAG: peptidoglycan editing factor PgeF [Candidatus Latescibacterota bacterium]
MSTHHAGTRAEGPIRVWRPPPRNEWQWLRALVTTRHGGSSRAPYDSLNLALSTGDAPQDVEANRALLRRVLGLEQKRWHTLAQVHGERVLEAGQSDVRQADGLWTARPGEVLVIGVADCVPVFLWDARGRRVALLHAGWRGTAAGIVRRGLEKLLEAGASAADVWMAMGPSIGPCCYAVGPEVARHFPEALHTSSEGRTHLDLRRANRRQALAGGVSAAHVLPDPPCTACETNDYFSHRKQGPHTGRQWALAWVRDPGEQQ